MGQSVAGRDNSGLKYQLRQKVLEDPLQVARYQQITLMRNNPQLPNLVKTLVLKEMDLGLCSEAVLAEVYVEQVTLLSEIVTMDEAYAGFFMKECLRGLAQLERIVGPQRFQLTAAMVGLSDNRVKIWFHSDFVEMQPEYPSYSKSKQHFRFKLIKNLYELLDVDRRRPSQVLQNAICEYLDNDCATASYEEALAECERLEPTEEGLRAKEHVRLKGQRNFLRLASSC